MSNENMNWNNDGELLKSLDKLMNNCSEDLNDFLNRLYRYREEIGLVGQAMLFGGIGRLSTNYLESKKTGHSIEESLALAFQSVHNDRRVQALMGHAIEKTIDDKVENMKGSE
tara:strand:- start:565 stop:903 length:339 start_codon:yes stop_codon:yes gene_type:complete